MDLKTALVTVAVMACFLFFAHRLILGEVTKRLEDFLRKFGRTSDLREQAARSEGVEQGRAEERADEALRRDN